MLIFRGFSSRIYLPFTALWLWCLFEAPGVAQQTNNSSTLNNSAAPSASSITSGGTNVNYQTNNTFNNDFGFGPGIICRTPSMYVGGNWGQGNQNNLDIANNTSSQNTLSYQANVGVVVPFGSPTIADCNELSRQIAVDRKISTDLSLIRACASLEKEGITVDPERFPYLERCARPTASSLIQRPSSQGSGNNLQPQQLAPKVPKTTKS